MIANSMSLLYILCQGTDIIISCLLERVQVMLLSSVGLGGLFHVGKITKLETLAP